MRRLAIVLAVPMLALVACGNDDGGSGADAFCDRAEEFDAEFAAVEAKFDGTEIPTGESFREAADLIEDFADGAPDEIGDDIRTMADAIRRVAERLDGLGFEMDDPDLTEEQTADLIEVGTEISDDLEALEEPSERIEDYLGEECGIDPDE